MFYSLTFKLSSVVADSSSKKNSFVVRRFFNCDIRSRDIVTRGDILYSDVFAASFGVEPAPMLCS